MNDETQLDDNQQELPFLPELHDLGKLIDNGAVVLDMYEVLEQGGQPALLATDKHLRRAEAWFAEGKAREEFFVPRHELDWIVWTQEVPEPTESPNYQLIRHHGGMRGLPRPGQPDRFGLGLRKRMLLTNIADHAASTFRRAVAQLIGDAIAPELPAEEGIHKLWRPNYYEDEHPKQGWAAATSVDELKDLLSSLTDPDLSAEEFLGRYRTSLRLTPEDKKPPRNVTALGSHVRLVGQIYRILEQYYATALDDDNIYALDHEHIATVKEAENDWKIVLATVRLHIPQHPVRVGDMNVFRQLENSVADVLDGPYKDHVLLYTNDSIWLLLPEDGSVNYEHVLAPILNSGFFAWAKAHEGLNLRTNQQEIRRLRWHYAPEEDLSEPVQEPKERAVYPEAQTEAGIILNTPETIDIPLCEICQMRHADRTWPTDSQYDEVKQRDLTPEQLCSVCFNIRDVRTEDRFHQLARWRPEEYMSFYEELGEEIPIRTAWVKTTLNFDTLIEWLNFAYTQYLEDLRPRIQYSNGTKTEEALTKLDEAMVHFNPLALMADFTEDYRRLTDSLNSHLQEQGWAFERITERIYKDFYVIKMERGKDLFNFLNLYWGQLTHYFPAALEPSCPLRLSLSLSQAKYPFYQHWEWLRQPAAEINIQVPGTTYFALPARHFHHFLELDVNVRRSRDERIAATYLHRLATIEQRTGGSRLVPQATFLEDWNRNRLPQLFQPFLDLIRSEELRVSHLLAWYKLTSWS